MTTNVEDKPPVIKDEGIKSGEPVTAKQWRSISKLAVYLHGSGGTLVPAHPFMCDIGAVGG